MTYKLGDRVVVTRFTRYSDLLVGKTGTVTATASDDMIGVTLDDKPSQYITGRIYFTPSEIELDKNYIVTQILNDL